MWILLRLYWLIVGIIFCKCILSHFNKVIELVIACKLLSPAWSLFRLFDSILVLIYMRSDFLRSRFLNFVPSVWLTPLWLNPGVSTKPANVSTALLTLPPLLSSGSLTCRAVLQHSVEFHSVCVKESEPLAFTEKPLLGTPACADSHPLYVSLWACAC